MNLEIRTRSAVALAGCTLSLAAFGGPGRAGSQLPAETQDRGILAERRTELYFESLRDNPTLLRAFFLRMPKGGDIHHHTTGAVYAETLIDLAAGEKLCVVERTGVLCEGPCDGDRDRPESCSGPLIPVASAYVDGALYDDLVDRWSLRDFNSAQGGSANDNFFDVFPRVSLASGDLGAIWAALRKTRSGSRGCRGTGRTSDRSRRPRRTCAR